VILIKAFAHGIQKGFRADITLKSVGIISRFSSWPTIVSGTAKAVTPVTPKSATQMTQSEQPGLFTASNRLRTHSLSGDGTRIDGSGINVARQGKSSSTTAVSNPPPAGKTAKALG
jgi:hypothetical protein